MIIYIHAYKYTNVCKVSWVRLYNSSILNVFCCIIIIRTQIDKSMHLKIICVYRVKKKVIREFNFMKFYNWWYGILLCEVVPSMYQVPSLRKFHNNYSLIIFLSSIAHVFLLCVESNRIIYSVQRFSSLEVSSIINCAIDKRKYGTK